MARLFNLARMSSTTTGTGSTIALDGGAVSGYLTFALAGVANGQIVSYGIKDGSSSEVGTAVYASAGPQLTSRTPRKSTNSDAAINLSGAAEIFITARAEDIAPIDGVLFGLTLSTAGSSATFATAIGHAADSTALDIMRLGAAISKTTSSWAVGSGNGGLDTGAIANSTWYHVHLIKRLDTSVVDVLISLSATAPTLPANYTIFRRIGSLRTNGSAQWVLFTQVGDRFRWSVPVLDVSATSYGAYTSVVTSSPTGVQCLAFGNVVAGTGASTLNIRPVGAGDAVSALTASPLAVNGMSASGNSIYTSWQEMTDLSAQISLGGNSTVNTYLTTAGWFDTRGRLA